MSRIRNTDYVINCQDLGEKVVTRGLVIHPRNLTGFSCAKCPAGGNQLDTTTEKGLISHMKEVMR